MRATQASGPQRQTQAPGQYLGYSLQASRLLDHLLISPRDVAVSLEAFADTGIEYPDGHLLAEELKSRTTSSNPVGNHAVDLWKTFRNWAEAALAGVLDAETTRFRLHVTSSFQADVVARFSNANSDVQAVKELEYAQSVLFGSDDDKGNLPAALSEHVTVFFSTSRAITTAIIRNFELSFGSGRSLDSLKESLDGKWVPREVANDVIAGLLGWLKLEIDGCIERGEPAVVRGEAFHVQATLLVRKLDRRDFLASVAHEPTPQEVDAHLAFRTYVRQLELIGLEEDDKLQAVTDFLLAEADRVDWAAKGRVLSDSYDTFETELRAAWKNYKRRCDAAHVSSNEVDRGKVLYSDCFVHPAKLDGIAVPEHFCRGSFHKLSDYRKIGWHPQYAKLLPLNDSTPGDDGNDTR